MRIGSIIDIYHSLSPNIKASLTIILLLIIFVLIASVILKKYDQTKAPKGLVLILEILVGWINSLCYDNLGKRGRKFAPMILTMAMFIFVANISGLFGLANPTANIAITVALGFISFFMIHGAGIKYNGFKNYLKGYLDPSPVMLPINIVSEIVTPFSLGMRLFGNILSGSIIMILVYGALAILKIGSFPIGRILSVLIAPFFHAIFDVFFGAIQTYVFIFLTTIFISGKLPDDE